MTAKKKTSKKASKKEEPTPVEQAPRYRVVNLSEENLNRLADAGYRLHSVRGGEAVMELG